jgi:hypothetical protein
MYLQKITHLLAFFKRIRLYTSSLLILFCLNMNVAWSQVTVGQCETPNVLLLLDRSGSMLDDNKWMQAQEAIEGVFFQFIDQLRFGVLFFPWMDACGVGADAYRIPFGTFSEESASVAFSEATPERTALTPLAGALDRGRQILEELNEINRNQIIILLTDGVETCHEPEARRPSAPVEAAQLAADAGFTVYTVGFGSLVSTRILRSIAEVGGTDRERSSLDFDELVESLTDIVERAINAECAPCIPGCDEGYICVGARCALACSVTADCPEGVHCEDGACREEYNGDTQAEDPTSTPSTAGSETAGSETAVSPPFEMNGGAGEVLFIPSSSTESTDESPPTAGASGCVQHRLRPESLLFTLLMLSVILLTRDPSLRSRGSQ